MRVCGNCGASGHNRRTCVSQTPTVETSSFKANENTNLNRYEKKAVELLHILDKYMVLKVTSPSQYENYLKDTSKFLADFAEKVA